MEMMLPKNGKMHRKAHARTRNEVLDVYSNLEIKRDMRNQFNYDRVEELYSSFYGGLDPRRKVEIADGGMVREDRNAMSNLPVEGYQAQYPNTGFYTGPYVDDSVKE